METHLCIARERGHALDARTVVHFRPIVPQDGKSKTIAEGIGMHLEIGDVEAVREVDVLGRHTEVEFLVGILCPNVHPGELNGVVAELWDVAIEGHRIAR